MNTFRWWREWRWKRELRAIEIEKTWRRLMAEEMVRALEVSEALKGEGT